MVARNEFLTDVRDTGPMDQRSSDFLKALKFVETLESTSLDDDRCLDKILEFEKPLNADERLSYWAAIAKQTGISQEELLGVLKDFRMTQMSTKPIQQHFSGFPYPKLHLPFGYTARMNTKTKLPEIILYDKKKTVVVSNVAAFPIRMYIPKAKATLDHPELYQLTRYNPGTGLWEEVPQVFKKSYLCYAGSIHNLADTGISVGSANASELAKFFQLFIDTNAKNLEIVETVHKFGWVTNKSTGEKTFAPFFGSYTVVPASGDMTEKEEAAGDFELVKKKAGNRNEAVAMVQEMKENKVFLTMLAGMFAGPVVYLLREHLQESIGIDLSGKTSKGKTSVQKIAFNLVYGNANPFTRSWEGATPNGIWGIAGIANHLPFILDDSHLIRKHTANMPHALINGFQGDKMQVNKATNELSLRERKTVMTVMFFNGEVQLSEQTLISNSRGLLGRVIMVRALPFPETFTSEQVKAYVRRSYLNRGHFRDDWLTHLSKLDPEATVDQVMELTKLFEVADASSLYGRLTSKAATLYWSLKEANEVLGLGLEPDILIPFLIEQMTTTTTNGDINEEIVRDIVEHVKQHSAQEETFHPFTPNRLREGYNSSEDDFFLVKRTCLEKIVKERRKIEPLLDELHNEGYLTQKGSRKVNYKTREGSSSSTTGYSFSKKFIRDKLGIYLEMPFDATSAQKPDIVLTESRTEFETAKQFYAGSDIPVIRTPQADRQKRRTKV